MNNIISLVVLAVIAASMLVTWRLTKPLGTGRRLSVLASQALAIAVISSTEIHRYYVWFYNMREAERFVRKMAEERGWFGDDASKRDEIIGLVFSHANHLGEPAENVKRAIEKVEELGKVNPPANRSTGWP